MGLDNGIVIKTKLKRELDGSINKLETPMVTFDIDNHTITLNGVSEALPTEVRTDYYLDSIYFAYWRRFYRLKHDIVHLLSHKYTDNGYTDLTPEDIENIISIIENSDDEEPYWEPEVVIFSKEQNLPNLYWLKDFMKKNPSVVVYFYDCY